MSNSFGNLMRHWRRVRRYSQLALSVESGLSSRHISFLETGRAKPSRSSVLTLVRVLEMPKQAANDALLAAGFAPHFPTHDPSDEHLAPMMEAITTILDNHAPMPAVVIDGGWQIVGGNGAAMHMMQFMPFRGSMCTVDALLNDDPMNPVFANWKTLAAWTLLQLQVEVGRDGGQGPLAGLYERLSADPRLADADLSSLSDSGPFLPLEFRAGPQTLSLFSMLAQFSSAQDVMMSGRRIELFFPADAGTKAFFETLELPT